MNYQPQAPGQPGQPAPVFELSGWWARAGALIIDGIITGAISFGLALILGLGVFSSGLDQAGAEVFTSFDATFTLLSIAISSIYYCGMMASTNGQTVGKQATRIRVVREDGKVVDVVFAFVRQILVIQLLFNTLGAFLLLPPLLNYLWPIWDDKNKALHDKIVKSRVVKTDPVMYQQYGPPGQVPPAGGYPPQGQPYAPPGQPYAPPPPDPFAPAPQVPPAPPPGQPYAPPAPPRPAPPPPQPGQAQPPPAPPPMPQQQPMPQPPTQPGPPQPYQPPPGPSRPPAPQPPGQPQPYQPPPAFTNPVPDDD